jgi:2'-5' RNA ligase
MIRAFIALDIPDAVRQAAATLQSKLRRLPLSVPVSWVKIDNLHLTLQFLGDADESRVAEIGRALDDVTARVEPFELQVRGVGAFPDSRRPRVLWIGCRDAAGQLTGLAADAQRAMTTFGYRADDQPFAGHLTIGRVKGMRPDAALTRALDCFKDTDLGAMRVEAVHLFQSRLHPQGSIYTRLSSHQLGGTRTT